MPPGSFSLRSRYRTESGPGAVLAMRPNRRETSWLVKGARRSCSISGSSGGVLVGWVEAGCLALQVVLKCSSSVGRSMLQVLSSCTVIFLKAWALLSLYSFCILLASAGSYSWFLVLGCLILCCWPFAPLSGGCGRCCVRGVPRLSSFIFVMSLVISSVAISISSSEFALSISCNHLV